MQKQPEYPLTVTFHESGEIWTLVDLDDAACNLEWFDSDDPEEQAVVVDNKGRPVRLKIESLKVIKCELKE
jgi:hypothetical protein